MSDHYLFWYDGKKCRNFGDHIGKYLYEKIMNKSPIFAQPTPNNLNKTIYLTVGSILYWSNQNTIIWGSGIISKTERLRKPKEVLAVRGPLTQEHLKTKYPDLQLPNPPVYGDPALLLPRFYQSKYKSQNPKKYQIGIVPHTVDYQRVRLMLKQLSKDKRRYIKLINLDIPYEIDKIHEIIDEICQCDHILSSSLHGIVIAHAYQVSATWLKFSNKLHGDDTKFHDYFQSLSDFPEAKKISAPLIKSLPYKDIIKYKSQTPQPKFPIDTEALWNSCPFKLP